MNFFSPDPGDTAKMGTNFSTFFWSLLTLWQMVVTNNWPEQVQYTAEHTTTTWVKLYFISFMFLVASV